MLIRVLGKPNVKAVEIHSDLNYIKVLFEDTFKINHSHESYEKRKCIESIFTSNIDLAFSHDQHGVAIGNLKDVDNHLRHLRKNILSIEVFPPYSQFEKMGFSHTTFLAILDLHNAGYITDTQLKVCQRYICQRLRELRAATSHELYINEERIKQITTILEQYSILPLKMLEAGYENMFIASVLSTFLDLNLKDGSLEMVGSNLLLILLCDEYILSLLKSELSCEIKKDLLDFQRAITSFCNENYYGMIMAIDNTISDSGVGLKQLYLNYKQSNTYRTNLLSNSLTLFRQKNVALQLLEPEPHFVSHKH